MDVVEKAENLYSKMLGWEVWNFMSIKHGKVEFDERNIINLKGYNDSGKSAMLRALDVLFFNIKPQKQTEFIHDDENYFRVVAYFNDGVSILRDKYINGQSLYEMYKDDELIFTTKNGNALTKVSEVPTPIKDYLGLIFWEKTNINSRSCWEQQLLVETKGSENYQMLNTILKSEEIAIAGSLLNNDKNKLASDINSIDYELQATKDLCKDGSKITKEMLDYLKEHDKGIDISDEKLSSLNSISVIKNDLGSVVDYPQLDSISLEQLNCLTELSSIVNELNNIVEIPEVKTVDSERLNLLATLSSTLVELSGIKEYPEVDLIDMERINTLSTILSQLNSIVELENEINNIDNQQRENQIIIDECQAELGRMGVKTIKCPNCGETIVADSLEAHIHQ